MGILPKFFLLPFFCHTREGGYPFFFFFLVIQPSSLIPHSDFVIRHLLFFVSFFGWIFLVGYWIFMLLRFVQAVGFFCQVVAGLGERPCSAAAADGPEFASAALAL